MTNDTTKTCRRCGGKLEITIVSNRKYEKCAKCRFQYPVVSLMQS